MICRRQRYRTPDSVTKTFLFCLKFFQQMKANFIYSDLYICIYDFRLHLHLCVESHKTIVFKVRKFVFLIILKIGVDMRNEVNSLRIYVQFSYSDVLHTLCISVCVRLQQKLIHMYNTHDTIKRLVDDTRETCNVICKLS